MEEKIDFASAEVTGNAEISIGNFRRKKGRAKVTENVEIPKRTEKEQ